jgi:hypothetical protein
MYSEAPLRGVTVTTAKMGEGCSNVTFKLLVNQGGGVTPIPPLRTGAVNITHTDGLEGEQGKGESMWCRRAL